MDLLIQGGTVVTMDAERHVAQADVLVRDGRIVAVGDAVRMQRHGPARVLDASHGAVLPGFVQAHVQLAHTLARGQAAANPTRLPPLALEPPLSTDALRASVRLGMAELLLSGTTAALDLGLLNHMEPLLEAGRDLGLRLTAAAALRDLSDKGQGAVRSRVRSAVAEAERLRNLWHGANQGRIRFAFAPSSVTSCTEELLVEIIGQARSADCLLHARAAESTEEAEKLRARGNGDAMSALQDIGLTGDDVVLAHGTAFSAREHKLIRETGTHLAYCPVSALATGGPMLRLGELLAQGLSIALGSGSALSAGRLDLFDAMRLVQLWQRGRQGAVAISPMEMLELCTLRGAQALGLGADIGSIEVGKRADLLVLDLRGMHTHPAGDVVTAVATRCRADDVRHVVVDGTPVVHNGQLTTADVDALRDDASRALERPSQSARQVRRR